MPTYIAPSAEHAHVRCRCRTGSRSAARREVARQQRLADAAGILQRLRVADLAPFAVGVARGHEDAIGRLLRPMYQPVGDAVRIRRRAESASGSASCRPARRSMSISGFPSFTARNGARSIGTQRFSALAPSVFPPSCGVSCQPFVVQGLGRALFQESPSAVPAPHRCPRQSRRSALPSDSRPAGRLSAMRGSACMTA